MLKLMLLCVFCFSLIMTSSCGRDNIRHVKDFRIYIATEDDLFQKTIKILIEKFNKDADQMVLKSVDKKEDSNSSIRFIYGLRDNGRTIGLGQWKTSATHKVSITPEGKIREKVIEYGMELFFDEDNFRQNALAIVGGSDSVMGLEHLYHLFCHEVGHGIQMDHEEDTSQVMYPTIPLHTRRSVDYNSYFYGVKEFMGDVSDMKENVSDLDDEFNHHH